MTKTTTDNTAIIYLNLLYGIFQRSRANPHFGVSLAVTSANPGEGVTRTIRGLANALGQMSTQRVLVVEFDLLQRKSDALEEIISAADLKDGSHIRELYYEAHTNGTNGASVAMGKWHRSIEYRRSCIRRLCVHFDVVLIDCQALRRSSESLSVAAAVDGVILVIQAGKTTKADVAFAERQIAAAGGNLEGHVLNKPSSSFREWFLRMLAP
jgi:Mrp family chromosome partitioning ATPase